MSGIDLTEPPPVGVSWAMPSRIWGEHAGTGDHAEALSPLNGKPVQQVRLLSNYELASLFELDPPPQESRPDIAGFAKQLLEELTNQELQLFEAMRLETGFSFYDCREMILGVFEFLRGAETHLAGNDLSWQEMDYSLWGQIRKIRLSRSPWGTVAVILPQNAFLILAVTAMLNAIAAGNRVVIRSPLGSARSAALLARAIDRCDIDHSWVSIVLSSSREFCQAVFQAKTPRMLHYMGSSRHAGGLLKDAFESGVHLIVDGEGNCWTYVDQGTDPDTAARILHRGALRYNGQTCTSINGAIVHPTLYQAVKSATMARWNASTAAPLFDAEQASWCLCRVRESKGRILIGAAQQGNTLAPTLVENPQRDSELVRQGVFGPVMWLASGTVEDFAALWQTNKFPLCAGVLSPQADGDLWAARLHGVARISVNGDPSVESVFEPWGGYPMSGVNTVGPWLEKYQRIAQVDEPLGQGEVLPSHAVCEIPPGE